MNMDLVHQKGYGMKNDPLLRTYGHYVHEMSLVRSPINIEENAMGDRLWFAATSPNLACKYLDEFKGDSNRDSLICEILMSMVIHRQPGQHWYQSQTWKLRQRVIWIKLVAVKERETPAYMDNQETEIAPSRPSISSSTLIPMSLPPSCSKRTASKIDYLYEITHITTLR